MALPSSPEPPNVPEPTRLHYAIVEALNRGQTTADIARRLAKGDKAKAKKYRAKLRRMLAKDLTLQKLIVEHSNTNLLAGLPGATAAAVKRAHRGRMDAIKFVAESTGFHNPRVQHDHSGEVKIKIDIPRPNFADTEAVGDDRAIEDADVVEDGHPAEA